jgi:predicted GH43/DUF377 family glycosyl hydrolase
MMNKFLLFLLLCFSLFSTEEWPDLEDQAQNFVLETKRLEIPNFPGAFNPSITRYRGELLMSFRIRYRKKIVTNQIGLIFLDEEFNFKSEPYILEYRGADIYGNKQQDPRLITIGDRLYILFNNLLEKSSAPEYCDPPRPLPEIRKMFVAELFFDGKHFYIQTPDPLIFFEGSKPEQSEKNWVPFEYQEQLLLAHSLTPHRIFRPFLGTRLCGTVACTRTPIQWDWGVLRGGTPALLDGDHYLAFFHSSKLAATAHSQGKKIQHYVMGAYTFEADPPFAITSISKEPIVGKNFYHGLAYKTWKPLHVVFPGGYIMDEHFIWVFYGRQDFEIWAAKLDKKELYQSLVPIQ